MKKTKKVWKHKKRETTLVLVSVMVLSLFFSGYSIGKQYSNTKINASSKIAEPILIVENGSILKMNGKKEKEYYDFKVKNYKEDEQMTQIELEYVIEILFQKEEAISFKLYKDNQEIFLQNNKTENMRLKKESKQEDNYRLEIIYDKTKNQAYHDILQEVQIKVHSEQVKA